MFDIHFSSRVCWSTYEGGGLYARQAQSGTMAPRRTQPRTKSPPPRRRPRKAASKSQTPGLELEADAAPRAQQSSNSIRENVAASSGNEPVQDACSRETPTADSTHTTGNQRTSLQTASAESGGFGASSLMTRRGLRVRTGSAANDPDQTADELRSVTLDLCLRKQSLRKCVSSRSRSISSTGRQQTITISGTRELWLALTNRSRVAMRWMELTVQKLHALRQLRMHQFPAYFLVEKVPKNRQQAAARAAMSMTKKKATATAAAAAATTTTM
eukprot:2691378-Pleurochrysis_carterae.AAC.1